jgi:hypothetical protein
MITWTGAWIIYPGRIGEATVVASNIPNTEMRRILA